MEDKMPESIIARADFEHFVNLAKAEQLKLNTKTVAELNAMLANDKTGLVMGALHERATFEDIARTQCPGAAAWERSFVIAQLEWALPWPGEKDPIRL